MKRFGFFLGKILISPLFPLKTKGRPVSGKTCFVATLTPAQMKSLREQLASISAWEFSDGPYMLFKASREKTQVAAYRSGKLVVQSIMVRRSSSRLLYSSVTSRKTRMAPAISPVRVRIGAALEEMM